MHLFFTPLQSKMQTDQEEQQGQGDGQKETEEKAPRENEEMEVRCSILVLNKHHFIRWFIKGETAHSKRYLSEAN